MSTLTSPAAPLRTDATTIGVVGLAHGVSHFCQLVVPPLFPWLSVAFGLSNIELGLLLTVFYGVSFAGQAAAGFVVDRYGAARVLFLGLGLLALATAGMALAPNYAVMLACMALAGAGNCVFHPVDFSILNARVSPSRLGNAYAVHGISGNVGWALAPLFVVGIASATGSWRMALAGASAVAALVLLLVWWQQAALGGVRRPERPTAGAAAGSFDFLRLPAVWACFVFFVVSALSLSGLQSFAAPAAGRMHALAPAQVALVVSVFMVASGVGMLLGGQLVRDPERCVRIAGIGYGIAGAAALAVALGQWSAFGVLACVTVMGLGSGIAGPSRDLLVKQATPPGATGRVYGVVYSGLDVGMTLAPLGFGVLMDAGRDRGVWLVIAALLGVMIVTAINVRRAAPRRQALA